MTIRRTLCLTLLAPAAVLALAGTAAAETPAQQPAPFQLVLPAEPVQPKGPGDIAVAPHVDPKGPELAPAPTEAPEPKPQVPGPADLADDVTDPGPHPAPHDDLPIAPAPEPADPGDEVGPNQPADPVDGPDDKAGPDPVDGGDAPTGPTPDDSTGDGVEPTDASTFGDGATEAGSAEVGTTTGAEGRGLPFTGTSTVPLLGLGLALTAAGLAAQRVARARS